jgi:hypothetical protein
VLGDGKDVGAFGLSVPARHAGEAMRDILALDVERRGVQQIEPPPGQHSLPGT